MSCNTMTQPRSILTAAARLVLGLVFVISAVPKLVYPGEFYMAVLDYGVVGPQAATLVAAVLPWIELAAGVGLITGIARGGAMLTAAMLMMFFTGLHAWVIGRGAEVTCGCFGVLGDKETVGYASLTRNALLLALAVAGLAALTRRPSITPAVAPDASG